MFIFEILQLSLDRHGEKEGENVVFNVLFGQLQTFTGINYFYSQLGQN